ncbi:MAG: glycoside hydrolase family 88 protein [Verrucomicrobiota bacterium]|jgi:rhamnogalacturonyl hydrolase YesR|nr:glycoside hydrolase family 88 protein [Verrucomicrobiota bacterium]
MNPIRLSFCLAVAGAAFSLCAQNTPSVSDAWTLETVGANARLVADWMTANPKTHSPLDWTYGAFYNGIAALGLSDPALPYLDQIRELGKKNAWTFLPRTYHADDHCIGQSWLELAAFDNNPVYAEHIRQTYDYILANPRNVPLDFTKKGNQDRWSWCDALFMSPTVLVRLYGFTGDARYLDFMDREYQATADYLYSKEDHFFFRDSRYFDQLTPAGKHKYWSRGNGWVFGSLPIILRDLPADRPSRAFYLNLFKELAAALKKAQRADGAWSPNLGDPADPDMQEMSGTAFFTYGILWGVNNGVLDRADYLPVAQAGWKALSRNISAEGRLGWVQPIGDRPVAAYTAADTEVYAVGAYLCAAVELRKRIVADAHPARKTVSVANPLDRYRAAETVTLDWARLGLDAAKVRVFDVRNGAVLPHQLFDSDGDGAPDQLLFKTASAARQSREFWVFESDAVPAAPAPAVCVSRYAPDRLDDFLWENDRTAGRIYGPVIMKPAPVGQGLVSSGIDIWNKRVPYPVVDKWLKAGHYHDDHGEGMDNFSVGPSRGAGGLGVFNGGACAVSQNWATQRHLANGPVRTAFEVTYAPWDCGGGVTVAETRRMSLDAGSHLIRCESRFTVTGAAAALRAGPGISVAAKDLHNGTLTASPEEGWLANYEAEQPKKGAIATAVILPVKGTLKADATENVYLTAPLAADRPFVWYAGGGWSGAGDFVKPEYWNAYVASFAAGLRAPLAVELH